jgi:antitoxin component of MazEF toxin-antitoxin module
MQMEAEVVAKKWGNSFGVILPSDVVKAENIKENEKLVIEIKNASWDGN